MDHRPGISRFLRHLSGLRPSIVQRRYVIVCTKRAAEWRIAEVSRQPRDRLRYLDLPPFASIDAARRGVEELTARRDEA